MDNTSDEENDIIENTPPSSPEPKRKSGDGRDNERLPLVSIALKPFNEIQCMDHASTSPYDYGSSVPSIEPPPYSPLTPRNIHGTEKQIIPNITAFSPGIRPGDDRNARLPLLPLESVTENHCMNDALPYPYEYGSSVPSIELPPYSPLTPRTLDIIESQIRRTIPLSETAASSPVPEDVLSSLANFIDFDSDDSVKDVDYIQPKSKYDDTDETICESDDSRVSCMNNSKKLNSNKTSELTEIPNLGPHNEPSSPHVTGITIILYIVYKVLQKSG